MYYARNWHNRGKFKKLNEINLITRNQTISYLYSIHHFHIPIIHFVCHPKFCISSCPERNWKQGLCNFLGGKQSLLREMWKWRILYLLDSLAFSFSPSALLPCYNIEGILRHVGWSGKKTRCWLAENPFLHFVGSFLWAKRSWPVFFKL